MRALPRNLLNVDLVLRDRGYDGNWVREALKDKGLYACLRGRTQRKMISTDTKGATKLRSCLAGSRTGGVSQADMANAPVPSCLP